MINLHMASTVSSWWDKVGSRLTLCNLHSAGTDHENLEFRDFDKQITIIELELVVFKPEPWVPSAVLATVNNDSFVPVRNPAYLAISFYKLPLLPHRHKE